MSILVMYATTASVILAGITNIIFCKTSLYKKYKKPIDNGKTFKDGKRIFGDNKTIIGFFSMITFSIMYQIIFGILDIHFKLSELYKIHNNTIQFNIISGFLLGFAYMICELPNSFIKRRLGIKPGSTNKGIIFIIDQADSMIGISLVIFLLSKITLLRMLEYIIVGSLTHTIINLILKSLHLRRNI